MKIQYTWILLAVVTRLCQCFYSKTYKKCRLPISGMQKSSNTYAYINTDIGSLPMERVPEYAVDFGINEHANSRKPLQYQNIEFIFDQFIDSGGSGEVYRVQYQNNGQIRILKRFFKEEILQFQQQNYIMDLMKYQVKWHKQDNNPNRSTIASYPSKQSIVLRDLQVETTQQTSVVFYKICRELLRAHRNSVIHNDIKMGNILISSIGEGLRTVQIQLIDWNLATFYSRGYESTEKKGTICYYSPQAMVRTNFITPAVDVWALAVVMWSFITDRKPFTTNCKDDNLYSILTYVGSQKFLKVYQKYNKASSSQTYLVDQIKQNKNSFEGISLRDRIPQQLQKQFDSQLIDLFEKMLQVDPEYRLTIIQVLNHPYFDRVKRLPKMYQQKNKKKQKKQKQDKNNERHAPANNLVNAKDPTLLSQEQANSL